LLHDGHHRMSPIEAARLAKSLEPYDPFWLEDCTPGEDQTVLRLVRQHSVTPLAIGEVFNSVYDYQTLITERLIDYVRSSATHAGGITGLRQIMAFAAVYGIRSGFHGPTDVSPVGMAANLHLGLAIHNFGIQEYMPHSETTLNVFRTSCRFEAGLLHPGETPGLGVELDHEAAAAHEYQPAYLPVHRLRHGTVHDWGAAGGGPGAGTPRRPRATRLRAALPCRAPAAARSRATSPRRASATPASIPPIPPAGRRYRGNGRACREGVRTRTRDDGAQASSPAVIA